MRPIKLQDVDKFHLQAIHNKMAAIRAEKDVLLFRFIATDPRMQELNSSLAVLGDDQGKLIRRLFKKYRASESELTINISAGEFQVPPPIPPEK